MGGPSAENRTGLIMPFQRTSVVLGATALVFSATIASELWAPALLGTTPLPMTPPRPFPQAAGLPPSSGTDQAAIARLLARPLFNDGRRPAVSALAVPTSLAPPRLTGVFVSAQARSAIFAAAGDGKPVVLGVGDSVSAFRVQTIEAGQVTMVGADGSTRLLRPSFDSKPPLAHADAPAAQSAAGNTVSHRKPRPAVVTLSAPLVARTAPSSAQAKPPR